MAPALQMKSEEVSFQLMLEILLKLQCQMTRFLLCSTTKTHDYHDYDKFL